MPQLLTNQSKRQVTSPLRISLYETILKALGSIGAEVIAADNRYVNLPGNLTYVHQLGEIWIGKNANLKGISALLSRMPEIGESKWREDDGYIFYDRIVSGRELESDLNRVVWPKDYYDRVIVTLKPILL